MPLLTLITQQSLDEDYAHVAERRGAPAAPPPSPAPAGTGRPPSCSRSSASWSRPPPSRPRATPASTTPSRATLIAQVDARRRASVDRLQEQLRPRCERRRRALRDAADPAPPAPSRAPRARLRRLEAAHRLRRRSRGPGVRIVVDDAPGRRRDRSAVRDADLAELVDGLWEAGAEAISINGQRLTASRAIRNVGRRDPRQQPAR